MLFHWESVCECGHEGHASLSLWSLSGGKSQEAFQEFLVIEPVDIIKDLYINVLYFLMTFFITSRNILKKFWSISNSTKSCYFLSEHRYIMSLHFQIHVFISAGQFISSSVCISESKWLVWVQVTRFVSLYVNQVHFWIWTFLKHTVPQFLNFCLLCLLLTTGDISKPVPHGFIRQQSKC